MNVNQITDKIKEIAMSLETVNSVFDGNAYDNWNSAEIKYGSFNVGLQNVSNEGNLCTYTFVLYYGDRLLQDKSNVNSIYTDGVNSIQSVINVLNYMNFDISEQIVYTPFQQQFMDYLAGVYTTVNIVTSSSLGFCNMDEYNIEEIIEIVKNGVYDVSEYTTAVVNVIPRWGTIEGDIEEQTDLIELIDGKVNPLETRIETVEGDLSDLEEFTCGTIEPTTTNFVEGTSYTIHEALQRTANLFEGHQGEIDDINDLIPNQATEQNQLADKDFVNSTVATNAANFRGNWTNWTSVPTDVNIYPQDYVGNKTPTNNDYMVVQDASDYVNPSSFVHQLTVVNLDATKHFTIGVTNEYGEYNEYYYNNGFNGIWKSISTEYSLRYTPGAPGTWSIKTNKPEDTYIIKDGVAYSNANNGILLVRTNYSTTPVIIGIPSQAGQYQGSWRFIYVGTWATNGKLGWNPQYRIGSSFTAAQQAAIDSTITSTKVATYDGYGTSITSLQTDKLDKNYTANKIYGTDSLGSQTVYELGNGLAFENGKLVNTGTGLLIEDVTYSELVDLRDNEELVAGQQYRITDYTTESVDVNTRTARHEFDIIVTAVSSNMLSEDARAFYNSDRDDYFEYSDLNAWEIKYCLDNDDYRFNWADTDNGKGVIYYMKDEFGNEANYDFKNIMFKRYQRKYYSDSNSSLENSNLTTLDSDWNDVVGYKFVFGANNYPTDIQDLLKRYMREFLDSEGYQDFFPTSDYDNGANFDWGLMYSNQSIEFAHIYVKSNNRTYYANLVAQASTRYEFVYTFTTTEGNSLYDFSDIYDATVKGGDRDSAATVSYNNKLPIMCDSDGCYTLRNTVFISLYGDSVYNNIFNSNGASNTFGENTYNNVFNNEVNNSIFGYDLTENTFNFSVNNCQFSYDFIGNIVNNRLVNSSFSSDCHENKINKQIFDSTIGNSFSDNIIYQSLNRSVVKSNCTNNKFYGLLDYVFIANDFANNIILTDYTGVEFSSTQLMVYGDGKQIFIEDWLTQYTNGDGLNLDDGEFSVDIDYIKEAIEESHTKTAKIRLTANDTTQYDKLTAYVTTSVDRYYQKVQGTGTVAGAITNLDFDILYDDRNPLVTITFINYGRTGTNGITGFWLDTSEGNFDICMSNPMFTQTWKPSLIGFIPYQMTYNFNGSYLGITFQVNLKDYNLSTNGRIQLCDLQTSTMCYAEDTLITLSDGNTKMVQDITYNDILKVWDFDKGRDNQAKPIWIKVEQTANQYALVTLSDGNSIKLVGSDGKYHCMYDVDEHKFNHAVDCIGHNVYTENGIVKVESLEIVNEPVKFYNIVTNIHLNCYANHILTSTEKNNIYPINDNMKFIKKHKQLKSYKMFKEFGISYKDFRGWRLAEQPMSVEECVEFIKQRKNTMKIKDTELALLLQEIPHKVGGEGIE